MDKKEIEILSQAVEILDKLEEEREAEKQEKLDQFLEENYEKMKNKIATFWVNNWQYHTMCWYFDIRWDQGWAILKKIWKEYGTKDKKEFRWAFIEKNQNEEWYKKYKKEADDNRKEVQESFRGYCLAHNIKTNR